MFYGIKEIEESVSLRTFNTLLELEENGFKQVTKNKYSKLLADMLEEPYGKFRNGNFEKETTTERVNRENESSKLKKEKAALKEAALDEEFIARYNRLKNEGLIK